MTQTKPSLSKLSIKRRLFPRGLSFTREGKVYVFVTLGVGFASVNTGNNLLFMVLGMMLGLIIVSGILSELTLKKIQIRRSLPLYAQEGAVFFVELALFNKKKFTASFSVEMRDKIENKAYKRRCFFLRVDPKKERAVSYKCEIFKRGYCAFNGITVSTKFPFGFFEKYRFIEIKEKILILPSSIDVSAPVLASASGEGSRTINHRGNGQEFLELRNMVNGDDPRKIHWKSSARIGKLIIKEAEQDSKKLIEIALDASAVNDTKASANMAEQNIRAAGTIVKQFIAQGFCVHLITNGSRALIASNSQEVLPLLKHLALLDITKFSKENAPCGTQQTTIIIGPEAKSNGTSFKINVPKNKTSKSFFDKAEFR